MLAHKNEPVKQKDKKNSTAGKSSSVFLVMPPLRSTPRGDLISRSTERRKTDKQTPQQLLGWQEKMMLNTADQVRKASQSHVAPPSPDLWVGSQSFTQASLYFCSSERMGNLHHENALPTGTLSTSG